MDSLRALLSAVEKRDAERAESIMREETRKAAAEVMRLIAEPEKS
jgi:DNA-binding GntR family transcriptional regulator